MRKQTNADIGPPQISRPLAEGSKSKRGGHLTPKRPSVYLRTFGCQMNVRDSEIVKGLLIDRGYRAADSPEKADVVLFNTCSVRKHAEDRAINNVWRLRDLKKKRPEVVVGVIGCMAQAMKEEIIKKVPLVDFVCGPDDERDIPKLIEKIQGTKKKIVAVRKIGSRGREKVPEYRGDGLNAFVSIARGCDNYCSYCIVPYVRGRERSRKPRDIIREVRGLAGRGFKEIMLLGQNVNSYKGYSSGARDTRYEIRDTDKRKSDFVRLLEEINGIKGIERIKFMTSHPKDASRALFRAMRDLDRVVKHLHLPLQSGSDRILKLMNRKYTAKTYLKAVDDYRRLVSDGTVSTDIIVGFPSESEEDFKKTEDLMKKGRFDGAFIFKYSPRPRTKASRLEDDVPEKTKKERNAVLLKLQAEISKKKALKNAKDR
ncbi:MAG: tRNA (N6-isopentenyl adenosine(37)-C2)-methylthiotransferase MiaB [Candidatus Omnitrophota bacterium]